MLEECISSLQEHKIVYEIIIVNDCSKDKTREKALEYVEYKGQKVDLKVVMLEVNRGKGGAIRLGGLLARGQQVLMADADGATRFNDYYQMA